MNSFELYNPVRVFFGEGQVSHIDEQIPKDARVLLTYGGEVFTAREFTMPCVAHWGLAT